MNKVLFQKKKLKNGNISQFFIFMRNGTTVYMATDCEE